MGVGAFVFDRREQKVLMVQEKNGPLKGENAWEIATLVGCTCQDYSSAI